MTSYRERDEMEAAARGRFAEQLPLLAKALGGSADEPNRQAWNWGATITLDRPPFSLYVSRAHWNALDKFSITPSIPRAPEGYSQSQAMAGLIESGETAIGANVTITRPAAALAADIERRVIAPCAARWPRMEAQQTQRQGVVDAMEQATQRIEAAMGQKRSDTYQQPHIYSSPAGARVKARVNSGSVDLEINLGHEAAEKLLVWLRQQNRLDA